MLIPELHRFLLQIACPESQIANTTAIRSTSTTDGSTSAATTTDPRITDMQAIMATGMGIEVTESVRDSAMGLDRASVIASVRIWDTVGALATDMVRETATVMVAGTEDTVATDIVHWAGGWVAGALVH